MKTMRKSYLPIAYYILTVILLLVVFKLVNIENPWPYYVTVVMAGIFVIITQTIFAAHIEKIDENTCRQIYDAKNLELSLANAKTSQAKYEADKAQAEANQVKYEVQKLELESMNAKMILEAEQIRAASLNNKSDENKTSSENPNT